MFLPLHAKPIIVMQARENSKFLESIRASVTIVEVIDAKMSRGFLPYLSPSVGRIISPKKSPAKKAIPRSPILSFEAQIKSSYSIQLER